MQHDARGLVVTIWNDSALEPFERAIRAFQTYRGDPLAALDEALSRDPDFAAAAATKALVLMTLFERRFADDALAVLDRHATALARATPREQALGAAAALMARGQWQAGARELEAILVEHPRDAVALQVAHLIDFVRGDALNLRNRLSRVLPHWSREMRIRHSPLSLASSSPAASGGAKSATVAARQTTSPVRIRRASRPTGWPGGRRTGAAAQFRTFRTFRTKRHEFDAAGKNCQASGKSFCSALIGKNFRRRIQKGSRPHDEPGSSRQRGFSSRSPPRRSEGSRASPVTPIAATQSTAKRRSTAAWNADC